MTKEKEILVDKVVEAGLGDKEFASGLKKENLVTMLAALDEREKKNKAAIKVVAGKSKTDPKKVTTVADLVRTKRIKSN